MFKRFRWLFFIVVAFISVGIFFLGLVIMADAVPALGVVKNVFVELWEAIKSFHLWDTIQSWFGGSKL